MALTLTHVIKCTLIQIENHYYVLKLIVNADVTTWFCGRDHYT